MSEQDDTPRPEPGQDVTVQAGLAVASGTVRAPEQDADDEEEG